MNAVRSSLLFLLLALMIPAVPPASVAAAPATPSLAIDPVVGPPGTSVSFVGVGFTPGPRVSVLLVRGLGIIVGEPTASSTGVVTGSFTMPNPARAAELTFGRVDVFAIDGATGRETISAPFLLTQDPAVDFPLPHGRFFRQANGTGGQAPTGFQVVNSQPFAQFVRFSDEFGRLGGVPANGFPATRPFVFKGFVTQSMQKSVFQWRPEVDRVFFVNVVDELREAGFDDFLFAVRATPRHLDLSASEAGVPFSQITRNRLAFLDANPAIRSFYFSADDPLLRFGLPTSHVEDFGGLFAIRLQRAVLQQWKVDVPWARAGQVVVANGGDIAKEVGFWPAFATDPENGPTFSSAIVVFEPASSTTVTSPIRIRGDARVFEATVSFDLLDERGETVGRGHTTARAGAPLFARFDAELAFRTDRQQRAILRVFEESAATGEPVNVVQIPLTIRP